MRAQGVAFGAATACPAGPPKSRAFYKGRPGIASVKWLFGLAFPAVAVRAGAVAVAVWRGRGRSGNPQIAGLPASFSHMEAFSSQAALQKFPDGSGAAGHAL